MAVETPAAVSIWAYGLCHIQEIISSNLALPELPLRLLVFSHLPVEGFSVLDWYKRNSLNGLQLRWAGNDLVLQSAN